MKHAMKLEDVVIVVDQAIDKHFQTDGRRQNKTRCILKILLKLEISEENPKGYFLWVRKTYFRSF